MLALPTTTPIFREPLLLCLLHDLACSCLYLSLPLGSLTCGFQLVPAVDRSKPSFITKTQGSHRWTLWEKPHLSLVPLLWVGTTWHRQNQNQYIELRAQHRGVCRETLTVRRQVGTRFSGREVSPKGRATGVSIPGTLC